MGILRWIPWYSPSKRRPSFSVTRAWPSLSRVIAASKRAMRQLRACAGSADDSATRNRKEKTIVRRRTADRLHEELMLHPFAQKTTDAEDMSFSLRVLRASVVKNS